MFRGIISLVLVLFFITPQVHAQDVKPTGHFLEDTIKIGVPVGFSLAVKHARQIDVVFPDSLYDFSPYELDHKAYFPTRSDSLISYDSAVYYLTSFEVDTVQRAKLPIFILHGSDSTPVFTDVDSIILEQLVTEIPDSVAVEAMPLKENTTYKSVNLQFNYPYFLIGAVIVVIFSVLAFLIFGKRIRKYFRLKRLKTSYEKFIDQYDKVVMDKSSPASKQAETLLILWKKYLEKLDQKPYTKLTTKEIIQIYQPKDIEGSLKNIDRTIYSKHINGEIVPDYTALKKYSHEKYVEKVEEVKND